MEFDVAMLLVDIFFMIGCLVFPLRLFARGHTVWPRIVIGTSLFTWLISAVSIAAAAAFYKQWSLITAVLMVLPLGALFLVKELLISGPSYSAKLIRRDVISAAGTKVYKGILFGPGLLLAAMLNWAGFSSSVYSLIAAAVTAGLWLLLPSKWEEAFDLSWKRWISQARNRTSVTDNQTIETNLFGCEQQQEIKYEPNWITQKAALNKNFAKEYYSFGYIRSTLTVRSSLTLIIIFAATALVCYLFGADFEGFGRLPSAFVFAFIGVCGVWRLIFRPSKALMQTEHPDAGD